MRSASDPGDTADPAELAAIIEALPECVGKLAADGSIVYLGGPTETVFGRPAEELIGMNGLELVDPADIDVAGERFRALFEAEPGTTDRMTMRVRWPNGTAAWIDSEGRTLVDPLTGERSLVMVTGRADDRVETQRALTRVEERFRELVEWIPAVVYEAETGGEGRFLYVSPQIEKLLGYSAEEWLADPHLWANSLHPDDRAWVVKLEGQQAADLDPASAKMIGGEYRMVHRDGHTVQVRDFARLIAGENRRYWRGMLIDLSSEQTAELSLREAHERYRHIVDGLPAAVYRAEVGIGGRWVFASSQIEQLLGYTPQEMIGDSTLRRACLHPEDRDRVEAEEEVFAGRPPGTQHTAEYRLRTRTGETVWVRDRAVLSEDLDGLLMIDGILTDISAERAVPADASMPADLYRLACKDCGTAWAAERLERCPECEGTNVEGVSLNRALVDLAAARRQVEGLLAGIHRHLEALGTNLRTAARAPLGFDTEPETEARPEPAPPPPNGEGAGTPLR